MPRITLSDELAQVAARTVELWELEKCLEKPVYTMTYLKGMMNHYQLDNITKSALIKDIMQKVRKLQANN